MDALDHKRTVNICHSGLPTLNLRDLRGPTVQPRSPARADNQKLSPTVRKTKGGRTLFQREIYPGRRLDK